MVSFNKNGHTPSSYWVASISNGKTVFQDRIAGIPNAWRRLAIYLKDNDAYITSIRYYMNNGTIIQLPSGQEGYYYTEIFRAFLHRKATVLDTPTSIGIGHTIADKARVLIVDADNVISIEDRHRPTQPFLIPKKG
jgi:hypothetical protein